MLQIQFIIHINIYIKDVRNQFLKVTQNTKNIVFRYYKMLNYRSQNY